MTDSQPLPGQLKEDMRLTLVPDCDDRRAPTLAGQRSPRRRRRHRVAHLVLALRAATSPLGVFTPPPSLLTISPITSFTSFLLLATIALSTCSLISLLVAATPSVCAFASPSALRDSR